jgi:hypothetical protein
MAVLTACSLTARKGWKEHGGREERTKTKQMEGERSKARPHYSRSRIMANVINTYVQCIRQFYCRETRLKMRKYTKCDSVPVALSP